MREITQKIAEGVKELPTLPTVYTALSQAIANPNCQAREVTDIISADQASAFRVLRLVNSPYYGFPGRIDSVARAVVILGFTEIKYLVLANAVMDLFAKNKSALEFQPSQFWAHSLAVGVLTRALGQITHIVNQENLFIAGVLHDLGKLVLFEFAEQDFTRSIRTADEQGCPLYDVEKSILGLTHPEAGALIAKRWNLPAILHDVILYHHQGTVKGAPEPLVAATHLANVIARALDMGFSGDRFVPEINEAIWDTLRIPDGALREMLPAAQRQYLAARQQLLHN